MPNLSPWQARFGSTQGRITPAGWTAPEGDYVFALGSDVAGVSQYLIAGDYLEISQTGDTTNLDIVRARARIRPPATIPNGASWLFEFLVDGAAHASREFTTGIARELEDLAALTGDLGGGNHALAFRLTLLGTTGEMYEVELPGVYLDSLTLVYAPDDIAYANRDPEPAETGIVPSTHIAFDLFDPSGGGVDTTTLTVYVAGLLAISGGVFQPAFAGPDSTITAATPDRVHVQIDLSADLLSLQVVSVSASVQQSPAGEPYTTAYSFTVADATAPIVAAAMATGHESIRVTFNESVEMGDGTGSSDALNPANYDVVLVGGAPAITPEIVGVALSTSAEVVLTTDIPMTRGATYTVIVTSVRDLFGNAVAAPNNMATFTGYTCPVPEGRAFSVWDWWTSNDRQGDITGDLRAWSAIYQEVIDLLLCEIDRFADYIDPDTAPEDQLDLMLWDLGNPFPFDLTELDKRRLLSVLVAIYKSKGTDPGIINAVRFFLGLEVTIRTPWIVGVGASLGVGTLGGEGVGEGPGTFVLSGSRPAEIYAFEVVSAVGLTEEERDRITQIVRYMKRAGTRFRIVEPTPPPATPNHLVLGLSRLGLNWRLH